MDCTSRFSTRTILEPFRSTYFDPFAALQSRERLIEAIDAAIALPATLEAFTSRGAKP
jgi:hypothetical protein